MADSSLLLCRSSDCDTFMLSRRQASPAIRPLQNKLCVLQPFSDNHPTTSGQASPTKPKREAL